MEAPLRISDYKIEVDGDGDVANVELSDEEEKNTHL